MNEQRSPGIQYAVFKGQVEKQRHSRNKDILETKFCDACGMSRLLLPIRMLHFKPFDSRDRILYPDKPQRYFAADAG